MVKEGFILKGYGGFYFVHSDGTTWCCRGRGKLRYAEQQLFAGDHVRFTLSDNAQEGIIETVLPRKNQLLRPPIANIDQVIFVHSFAKPEPDLFLLDRVLVWCGFENVEAAICFNKKDLILDENVLEQVRTYQNLGYKMIITSAKCKQGVEELKVALGKKVSVFAGPSGVGKSSLINAVAPGMFLKTGEVSAKLKKGRHTTKSVELFQVGDGFVADTPGFSNLQLPSLRAVELGNYFPEIKALAGKCRFPDCLHYQEPGCMVKQAVDAGVINSIRYRNYLQLLGEVKSKEKTYK